MIASKGEEIEEKVGVCDTSVACAETCEEAFMAAVSLGKEDHGKGEV